jgi:hypothetical protein
MAQKKLHRIRFMNEGKIFELYARQVMQGALFGFVEISEIVWGKKSDVIIDPSEQELRNEFAGVTSVQVPIHAVVRIDDVEKGAGGKIISISGGAEKPAAGVPIYTPSGTGPGKTRS